MVTRQVGRGGQTVDLSQQQESQAQKLAGQIIEKGGIVLFGEDRSSPLIRRAQFLSQDIRKRGRAVAEFTVAAQQKREKEFISKLPEGVVFKQDPRTRKLTPIDIRGKPPEQISRTVEVAPGLTQQLIKQIKLATPELKGIQLSQATKILIGGGLGTGRFAIEKAKGQLTELTDVQGRRIFTPTQAIKTVDLSVEVAKQFIIGKGVGKVATLGRGAIGKILPKVLQGSKKFKRIVNVLDVALLAGLTTNEAIKLKKTFETQGEDAALLQLIGLASFGAGFSRTGLKTPAQAQKEYGEFADL